MTPKDKDNGKHLVLLLACAVIAALLIHGVLAATPSGPSIAYIRNETSITSGNPTLESNAGATGGKIITLVLTARQQNEHYKAYVGNVSGAYVLEDASNFSIYEWSITTIGGEVFATRASSSVSWGAVMCANSTHVNAEMAQLAHTTYAPDDGINNTFDDYNNDHFDLWAGSTHIVADTCNYSTYTFVNDSRQTASTYFSEVLLYDGTSNLIYATKIEADALGYRNDSVSTHDFQMLVAENATPGASRINYYFYVELS